MGYEAGHPLSCMRYTVNEIIGVIRASNTDDGAFGLTRVSILLGSCRSYSNVHDRVWTSRTSALKMATAPYGAEISCRRERRGNTFAWPGCRRMVRTVPEPLSENSCYYGRSLFRNHTSLVCVSHWINSVFVLAAGSMRERLHQKLKFNDTTNSKMQAGHEL